MLTKAGLPDWHLLDPGELAFAKLVVWTLLSWPLQDWWCGPCRAGLCKTGGVDPAELAFARLVVWMLVSGWTGGSSVRTDQAGNVQTVSQFPGVAVLWIMEGEGGSPVLRIVRLDHTVSLKDAGSHGQLKGRHVGCCCCFSSNLSLIHISEPTRRS